MNGLNPPRHVCQMFESTQNTGSEYASTGELQLPENATKNANSNRLRTLLNANSITTRERYQMRTDSIHEEKISSHNRHSYFMHRWVHPTATRTVSTGTRSSEAWSESAVKPTSMCILELNNFHDMYTIV